MYNFKIIIFVRPPAPRRNSLFFMLMKLVETELPELD